jgi:hypothetical protein
LVGAFGINSDDALLLALSGIADLWWMPDFASLVLTKYGKTVSQINENYVKYTTGIKGTSCD